MKMIMGLPGSGKTIKLIEAAYKNNGHIVCISRKDASRIAEMAMKFGTPINFPLTYNEFINRNYHGNGIKEFYIDNIEILVQGLTDVPITMITLTEEENATAIPETGDKCTECNNGRIALMSSIIDECDMDDEPYESGVSEGNNDAITLNDCISLTVYACDNCGHVYAKWIE